MDMRSDTLNQHLTQVLKIYCTKHGNCLTNVLFSKRADILCSLSKEKHDCEFFLHDSQMRSETSHPAAALAATGRPAAPTA